MPKVIPVSYSEFGVPALISDQNTQAAAEGENDGRAAAQGIKGALPKLAFHFHLILLQPQACPNSLSANRGGPFSCHKGTFYCSVTKNTFRELGKPKLLTLREFSFGILCGLFDVVFI